MKIVELRRAQFSKAHCRFAVRLGRPRQDARRFSAKKRRSATSQWGGGRRAVRVRLADRVTGLGIVRLGGAGSLAWLACAGFLGFSGLRPCCSSPSSPLYVPQPAARCPLLTQLEWGAEPERHAQRNPLPRLRKIKQRQLKNITRPSAPLPRSSKLEARSSFPSLLAAPLVVALSSRQPPSPGFYKSNI